MSLSNRTPYGAQTRSKQHSVFGGDPFPQTLAEAHLSVTWDDAGRKYIDWMAALASVGLGHRWPDVEYAVQRQMSQGTALSLPTRLEYEVADALCTQLGWPDQVRWVKTGSEATQAAMMIARRATGRKKIVSIGYHGWHESHLPSENLVDVPWGVLRYWDHIDCTVAAVLVEPMRDAMMAEEEMLVAEYLRSIQAAAKSAGALVILDEMVTGFRWAIGGASELFTLQPDLACYGKAMANGYPLACVVGKKRLMQHAHGVSSTFGGEGVGLAAAKATLEVYQREPVIQRLWEVGRRLQAGVKALGGWPVHPVFTESAGWTESEGAIPLVQAAAKRGVLIHPAGMNPMYAHTDEDIERTIEVLNNY